MSKQQAIDELSAKHSAEIKKVAQEHEAMI